MDWWTEFFGRLLRRAGFGTVEFFGDLAGKPSPGRAGW
jgi:hypothetical protein